MSTWNIEKSVLSFTCDKVLTPDFKLLVESVTGNIKTMKCLDIGPGVILEPLLPGDFHKQQEKKCLSCCHVPSEGTGFTFSTF